MVRRVSLDDADDVARLTATAGAEDDGLNDVVRADLLAPHADSASWFAPSGLAHVQPDARAPRAWVLGVSAEPADWPDLVAGAVEHVRERGGGTITWWCAAADHERIASAERLGWRVDRRQHELRVRLPLGPEHRRATAPGVRLRTFEPGDADGVLAVNNAAFAGHAEQGGWTRSILEARMRQQWFDPKLFVIADGPRPSNAASDTPRIVGFNWLKPHPASAGDVARGEIYVIAVDPTEHGRGLGRSLAVHGLDQLHERGFEWASLFVAADNTAALALYDSLGFTTRRTDAAFVLEVAAR